MIRHINTTVIDVFEFKEKNPQLFKELIDIGIRIGFGEYPEVENKTALTPKQVREKHLPKDDDCAALTNAVIDGEVREAEKLTAKLLENGKNPTEIVVDALMPGIQAICEIYDNGDAFVPEILLANDALVAGVALCQDRLGDMPSAGRVACLVIEGDVHDIGKNIVAAILRANGFEVTDMGRDVLVEDAVRLAKTEKIDLFTGTSLMSTTKEGLKTLSEELKSLGVPVACGGAAVDEHFVETFSNSIYGKSPLDAVKIAQGIVSGKDWVDVRSEMKVGKE